MDLATSLASRAHNSSDISPNCLKSLKNNDHCLQYRGHGRPLFLGKSFPVTIRLDQNGEVFGPIPTSRGPEDGIRGDHIVPGPIPSPEPATKDCIVVPYNGSGIVEAALVVPTGGRIWNIRGPRRPSNHMRNERSEAKCEQSHPFSKRKVITLNRHRKDVDCHNNLESRTARWTTWRRMSLLLPKWHYVEKEIWNICRPKDIQVSIVQLDSAVGAQPTPY